MSVQAHLSELAAEHKALDAAIAEELPIPALTTCTSPNSSAGNCT
jgi:hypothetical protein